MNYFRAIVVEDDEEACQRHKELLDSFGCESTVFRDARSAREADAIEMVDLIIIDRKLPHVLGGAEQNEIGDDLLQYMLNRYPDTAFIVFTGFAEVDSVQAALRVEGSFKLEESVEIHRVQHFTKNEYRKFRAAVEQLSDHFRALRNIDLMPVPPNPVVRRALQRVTRHLGGVSAQVQKFGAGQSRDEVWRCTVASLQGAAADVVVKVSRKRRNSRELQFSLPASTSVAGPIHKEVGLLSGYVATVSQYAGNVRGTLFDLMGTAERDATLVLCDVVGALDALQPGNSQILRFEELVRPYISWTDLSRRLHELSLAPLDPEMTVTSRVFAQHGDLHPGNVLVCGSTAVLIDLESQTMGSGCVDPVGFLFGALFNGDSPFAASEWPPVEFCEKFPSRTDDAPRHLSFWAGSVAPSVFQEAWKWLMKRSTGDRDYWGMVLAFAARQMAYDDIRSNELAFGRVAALVGRAHKELSS